MILGTAQITETHINVKLSDEYAKLHEVDVKKQQNNIKRQKDYIETTTKVDKSDYDLILDKVKNIDTNLYTSTTKVQLGVTIPKDPDEAIAKLDQIRKSASINADGNVPNKNIVMGVNLMKMKLQLQEINQS